MKNLFYLIIFFMIFGCSNNNVVYWCGDHPCINKKEKEAYFKKTMIVEIRDLKNSRTTDNSESEKVMRQAKLKEKRRIKEEKDLAKQLKLEEKSRVKDEKDLAKQLKLEEKRRIKEEKDLAKQLKLDEKSRVKDEKDLAKQLKLEEKSRVKDEKDLAKQLKLEEKRRIKEEKDLANQDKFKKKTLIKTVKADIGPGNVSSDSTKFNELVEKIIKKNNFRPYPDVNNIPN